MIFLRYCCILLSFSLCHSLSAQDFSHDFIAQYQGKGRIAIEDITIDDSGFVYATGSFEDTVFFGETGKNSYFYSPHYNDAFLTKTDKCGKLIWAKHYTGISQVHANSVKLDSKGNIYTTGRFGGAANFEPETENHKVIPKGGHDIYITKHTPDGNLLWAKQLGGSSGIYNPDLGLDADDNIFISGSFTYTVDFDPGEEVYNLTTNNMDVFIVKLNSDGQFTWAKQFNSPKGTLEHRANSIDNNGNIYLSGGFTGEVDFDPGTKEYILKSNEFGYNVFAVKLDRNGNFKWARKFNTASRWYLDIAHDNKSNVYITGYFIGIVDFNLGAGNQELTAYGGTDVFLLKLNASGQVLWVKQMGGHNDDYADALFIDKSGNVYSTGRFSSTANFNPGSEIHEITGGSGTNRYISVLNDKGEFIWAGSVNGDGMNYTPAIFVNDFGIYTSGSFSGTSDFQIGKGESHEISAFSQSDGIIHKISRISSRQIFKNDIEYTCQGEEVVLSPEYWNEDQFYWSTGQTAPEITISIEGIYHVNIKNCSHEFADTLELIYLTEEECTPYLYVPTAFSPNGDGLNDEFIIIGQRLSSFEIKIFNRWGGLIYRSDNPTFKWDGTLDGASCKEGLYMTYIQYSTVENPGKSLQHKSNLHLIR